MASDTYNKRKENGLCVRCGKHPPRPNRTMCVDCARQHRKASSKIVQRRKEKGLCVSCGQHPTEQGQATCSRCHEADRKRRGIQKRKWKSQPDLCNRCGRPKPIDGYAACKSCREKDNERAIRQYYKYKEQGLCPHCRNELSDSHVTCKNCRAKTQERRYPGYRQVMERDDHQCQLCGATEHLHIHHRDGQGITAPNINNKLDNLIVLCAHCHNAITVLRRCDDKQLAGKLIQD